MSNNLSVQQLLECLRELAEASPEDGPAIRAKHKRMGADDALFKAAHKYSEFWEIYGLIKAFEIFYWMDKVTEDVNEEVENNPLALVDQLNLNAFPWANKQDLDFKALVAWHLHNIEDKGQDPCLTEDTAMELIDRMRANSIDEGLYDE